MGQQIYLMYNMILYTGVAKITIIFFNSFSLILISVSKILMENIIPDPDHVAYTANKV